MVLTAWHDRRCAKAIVEALNKASAATNVRKKSWRDWLVWRSLKSKAVEDGPEGGNIKVLSHLMSPYDPALNEQAPNIKAVH